MENRETKGIRLEDLKDKVLGKSGTLRRDSYEKDLELEMIGEKIKQLRLERNMTQEELGSLIGVQRAQISRLEKKADNVTIRTIRKVASALQADLKIELLNSKTAHNIT